MFKTTKLYVRALEADPQPLSIAWSPQYNEILLLRRAFTERVVFLSSEDLQASLTSGTVSLTGPLDLCWSILHTCNLHCPYCLDGGKGLPVPAPSEQEHHLRQIISSQTLLTVDICGGEPLLHRRLYALLQAVRNAGIGITMTTHGGFLTQHAARLSEYLDSIRVSIDGSSPWKHDQFRGKQGLFDQMIQGVKAARQQGIRVIINTVAMQPNTDDWENIIQLAQDLGAAELWLLQFLPLGSGGQQKDAYTIDTQWFLERGKELQARYTTPEFTLHLRDREQAAAGYVVVYSNGTVLANANLDAVCQENRQIILGTLKDGTIDALWQRQFHSSICSIAFPSKLLASLETCM